MQVQERVGYLPENAPLYPELSVQRYLQLVADLRRIPAAQQRARLSDAIHATNLADRLTQPIGTLSKGYRSVWAGAGDPAPPAPADSRRAVGWAGPDADRRDAQPHPPPFGAEHRALFVAYPLRAEALCDRAVVIINGRVRADADLADLAESGGRAWCSACRLLVRARWRKRCVPPWRFARRARRADGARRRRRRPAPHVDVARACHRRRRPLPGALCARGGEELARARAAPAQRQSLESVFNRLATEGELNAPAGRHADPFVNKA